MRAEGCRFQRCLVVQLLILTIVSRLLEAILLLPLHLPQRLSPDLRIQALYMPLHDYKLPRSSTITPILDDRRRPIKEDRTILGILGVA